MLTVLQEKLGDAHGLAIAAASVTAKVEPKILEHDLQRDLQTMRDDARETRARCLEAEARFGEELAQEILARANAMSERAHDVAGAWFKAGTGPLAAWQFLAMGEAAEVAVQLAAAIDPAAPRWG